MKEPAKDSKGQHRCCVGIDFTVSKNIISSVGIVTICHTGLACIHLQYSGIHGHGHWLPPAFTAQERDRVLCSIVNWLVVALVWALSTCLDVHARAGEAGPLA